MTDRAINIRGLQIIWWGFDREIIADHWALKFWRWPTGRTLSDATAAGLKNFGFRALSLGPLEFRWWPNHKAPTQ